MEDEVEIPPALEGPRRGSPATTNISASVPPMPEIDSTNRSYSHDTASSTARTGREFVTIAGNTGFGLGSWALRVVWESIIRSSCLTLKLALESCSPKIEWKVADLAFANAGSRGIG